MNRYLGRIILGVGIVVIACGAITLFSQGIGETEQWKATVVESYPHDDKAFTQGLLFHEGELYEATGRRGQSTVRLLELGEKEPTKIISLDDELFGEGIAVVDDRLIQLTWQEEIILEYDLDQFKEIARHGYIGEGWGLAYDGEHLIVSDGTSTIRFLDPETFQVDRSIKVSMDDLSLQDINELEFVEGLIFANVWYKDYIVAISPKTGEVVRKIDCSAIVKAENPPTRDAAFNGIAYNPDTKEWFVTGKLWKNIYKVKIEKADRK